HHHPLHHCLPTIGRQAQRSHGAACERAAQHASAWVVLAADCGGRFLGPWSAARATGRAPHEALDLATGVDQPLIASEERVALGAEVDAEVRFRRSRRERIATRAMNGGLDVLWMDSLFHDVPFGAPPVGGKAARPVRTRSRACGPASRSRT